MLASKTRPVGLRVGGSWEWKYSVTYSPSQPKNNEDNISSLKKGPKFEMLLVDIMSCFDPFSIYEDVSFICQITFFF